ncbi:cell division protein ZapE [soil metagenome]
MTTDSGSTTIPLHLVDLRPTLSGAEMAAVLVPPRQFDTASFDSYRPDPDHPSQAETLEKVRAFSDGWKPAKASGFFGRGKRAPAAKAGIYLDGGFGVGKTHLLAALWHAAPAPKYFGTFIEFTALVGALGYAETVKLLTGAKLIAIDEFELDDPGDTMMMTRLLGDLVASGSKLAATSNTPPNALGEGRFAAQDFLREIQALADRFEIIRIDGLDYRRRDIEGHARSHSHDELEAEIQRLETADARFTVDSFAGIVNFLGSLHPSKYIKLLDDVDALVITDVFELSHQTDALRLVAFIDRVYDAQLPIVASGLPLDQVFAADMLHGGYRKKYLRSVSRLIASTQY